MVPKKAYLSNNRCADDIDYDDHQSCLQKCDNKIYNIFNIVDDIDMKMKTIICQWRWCQGLGCLLGRLWRLSRKFSLLHLFVGGGRWRHSFPENNKLDYDTNKIW